jgi:undecaprenyl pyrophosphate phosphatase UppP
MTLGWKLFVVFIAFCSILAVVIYFAFRERKLGRNLKEDDVRGQQASDARVLTVIFSSILGGMLLTFLVAWLVFF